MGGIILLVVLFILYKVVTGTSRALGRAFKPTTDYIYRWFIDQLMKTGMPEDAAKALFPILVAAILIIVIML